MHRWGDGTPAYRWPKCAATHVRLRTGASHRYPLPPTLVMVSPRSSLLVLLSRHGGDGPCRICRRTYPAFTEKQPARMASAGWSGDEIDNHPGEFRPAVLLEEVAPALDRG